MKIHYGHFLAKGRECRNCGLRWTVYEEKMTGVNMAVELLGDPCCDVVSSMNGLLSGVVQHRHRDRLRRLARAERQRTRRRLVAHPRMPGLRPAESRDSGSFWCKGMSWRGRKQSGMAAIEELRTAASCGGKIVTEKDSVAIRCRRAGQRRRRPRFRTYTRGPD